MLAAVKGVIQGNTIVGNDGNLYDYQRKDAIVTVLDSPIRKIVLIRIVFSVLTERGSNVDSYITEMRTIDRL